MLMKELRDKLEKLRADAEDCTLISRLATDKAKRELFARLAAQIRQMIAELEAAIEARIAGAKADNADGPEVPIETSGTNSSV